MPTESEALIEQVPMRQYSMLADFFPVYRAAEQNVYLVQSHVGMTNAAAATALALATLKPDIVLKIGCVGGNAIGIQQNDHIIPVQFFHAGAWLTRSQKDAAPTDRAATWLPLFGDLPYQNSCQNLGQLTYTFLPDPTFNGLYERALQRTRKPFHRAHLGSGDMVITDHAFIKHIRKDILQLPADSFWCTDNESYAIAQVCSIYSIPFSGVYFVASSDYDDIDGYDPSTIAVQAKDTLVPIVKDLLRQL